VCSIFMVSVSFGFFFGLLFVGYSGLWSHLLCNFEIVCFYLPNFLPFMSVFQLLSFNSIFFY